MNSTACMHHKPKTPTAVQDQILPALTSHNGRKDHSPPARRPPRFGGNTLGDQGSAETYKREEWVQLTLDADFPWNRP